MIVVTAGVAAPLTIIAAGLAVTLLATTVAEFTRAEPSAGSFITYVETGLGPRAGVVTALLVTVGYTVTMTGVFRMSGGLLAMTLAHYTSLDVPCGPVTVVLTIAAIWVTAKGVKLSTSVVGVALVAQLAVMVAICVVILIDRSSHLSSAPFSWAHLTGGLTGLSVGFPLALYMFIGWENGPALAEECKDPKRTVPRAIYISRVIGAALFIFFAYATVTGFHYDIASKGRGRGAERSAQLTDLSLQGVGWFRSLSVALAVVNQPVDTNRSSSVERQERQQGALVDATDSYRRTLFRHPEGTEELHFYDPIVDPWPIRSLN